MTLIEGVGDEVTDFFIVVSILLISWIAWCSTSISDQPFILFYNNVLILRQHTRNRIAEFRSNHTADLTNNNSELNSEQSSQLDASNTNEAGNSCPESSSNAGSGVSTEPAENPGTPATSGTAENASGPEAPIRSEVPETSVPSEETLIQAMDSNNSEDSRSSLEEEFVANNSSGSEQVVDSTTNQVDGDSSQDDQISIKLKFMNDEQKLVTACLKEILGDFKRRHFQMELESRKLVRLVFKGHILQPDSLTLERCGLYNNCVVHCLVHQPRASQPSATQTANADSGSPLYFNPQNMPAGTGLSAAQPDWDLSKVFLGVLILILGLAWYTRYYYAQHYNVTSTIVLYALTTIFVVSVLSQFFPEEEGLRNID